MSNSGEHDKTACHKLGNQRNIQAKWTKKMILDGQYDIAAYYNFFLEGLNMNFND